MKKYKITGEIYLEEIKDSDENGPSEDAEPKPPKEDPESNPSEDNLLSNGGFEEGQKGWNIRSGGGYVTDEDKASGKYSLRIKASSISRDIPVAMNTEYHFSFRYKLLNGGLRLYANDRGSFDFAVSSNKGGGGWDTVKGDAEIVYDKPLADGWREALFKGVTGINTRGFVHIYLYASQGRNGIAGDAYLDDFYFSTASK